MSEWILTSDRKPARRDSTVNDGVDCVIAQDHDGKVKTYVYYKVKPEDFVAWQPFPEPCKIPEFPREPDWYCPKKDPPRLCDASLEGYVQACTEKKRSKPLAYRWSHVRDNPGGFWWWHPMNTEPVPVSDLPGNNCPECWGEGTAAAQVTKENGGSQNGERLTVGGHCSECNGTGKATCDAS